MTITLKKMPDDDSVVVAETEDYFLCTDDDCRAIDEVLHRVCPSMIGRPRPDWRFLICM